MMNKNFYCSKEWRSLRERKLTLNPLCQDCESLGLIEPANHVDHIESISSGGEALDINNLRSLCISCHSRKTVYRDGGFGKTKQDYKVRAKGCDANGMPIDPNHHWSEGGDS